MKHFAFSVSLALAGCHPPDQAIYDNSKKCLGVFDVALSQIPPNQFRRAGLYHDDVDQAALDTVDDAEKFGANTGLTKKEVLKEVARAKEQAWKAYAISDGQTPSKPSQKLLAAVKECMPKPPKPNE